MSAVGTGSRKLVIIEVAMVTVALVVIATLLYRAFFVVQAPKADEVLQLPDAQSLKELQVFPLDDPWNTDISNEPVDPNSSALIASIGVDKPLYPDFGTLYRGAPLGIPFTLVSGDQVKVPVSFQIADESDPGPYPIPPDAPIEGGSTADGDRHVIVLDKTHSILYELYAAFPEDAGQRWRAGGGAVFDLKKNSVQRPLGWTSADAAGLPIFPGLARYDQVVLDGKLTHALRFTVRRSRRAMVYPATHFASQSTDANLPPMGMRVRLKRDYDISSFPPSAQVILQGLKTYGMILADNGSDWFISGAPDPRWKDDELNTLKRVNGSAFEVVRMRSVITSLDKTP